MRAWAMAWRRVAPFALAPLFACTIEVSDRDSSMGFDDEFGSDDEAGTATGGELPDLGDDASTSDASDASETEGTDTSGTTGEPLCDPTPASWDPWIGGPCVDDADCGFMGGVCLREDEGWPCGTCSMPCDLYCDDIAGAPETFCGDLDGEDPFAPEAGACLSKCDPTLLEGGGCRPGYSCALVERFNEPGTMSAVCLPFELAPPKTACQQELDAAGLTWIPAHVPLDHPDGFPNLDCIVEDPVRLYSPVNGIDYRYIESANPAPILVSCELARALDKFGDLLQLKDAVEVAHIGTYNCRVISGTETLSEHAFGSAIDLGGFTLADDTYMTVIDDWEDGVADPVTFEGQWLKDLTDARYEMGIFNIILTPEYNAAHDNHFHVDMTPGESFYQ